LFAVFTAAEVNNQPFAVKITFLWYGEIPPNHESQRVEITSKQFPSVRKMHKSPQQLQKPLHWQNFDASGNDLGKHY